MSAALAVLIIFICAPAVCSYADYTRVTESVNLREKPSTDAKVLKLVPMGYDVSVQDKGAEWTRVVFEETAGYIKSEFLEVVKGAPPEHKDASGDGQNAAGAASGAKSAAPAPDGGDALHDEATNTIGKALRYGSEGDAVRDLQNILTEKGVYQGPINGKFGPMTEEAVMIYQEQNGLEMDGVVGEDTLRKLTEKPHPPGTYRNGDEGDEVKKIQKNLKDKGFYTGPLNGRFGPLTEEAVRKFQHSCALETDGIVGKKTLELLNAPPKSPKPAQAKPADNGGAAPPAAKPAAKAAPQTAPNGVELIDWSDVKNILAIGLTAKVYDVRSGITYNVRSFSNGKHADVEPVTVEDTENLKRSYGGVWKWEPHPVWVTVNGRTIAGSINGMPHGGGVNSSNGMNGQVCLHFRGSSTHNSNKAYAQLHQDAVMEAFNAAKRKRK